MEQNKVITVTMFEPTDKDWNDLQKRAEQIRNIYHAKIIETLKRLIALIPAN